ncbi:MAG: hypothetical protein LBL08_01150 [Candidatus Nomurabacteria bacterium]|jgi:hypothetical protein|nr:hypothetical protein [Candidatus Nomurabacteria bacterium]
MSSEKITTGGQANTPPNEWQNVAEYLKEYPDAVVDVEKAHAMAAASKRNEENAEAFKKVALDELQSPDGVGRMDDSLKVNYYGIYGQPLFGHDADNVENRVVKAVKGGITGMHKDLLIDEVKRERKEAARRAESAAEEYDALQKM